MTTDIEPIHYQRVEGLEHLATLARGTRVLVRKQNEKEDRTYLSVMIPLDENESYEFLRPGKFGTLDTMKGYHVKTAHLRVSSEGEIVIPQVGSPKIHYKETNLFYQLKRNAWDLCEPLEIEEEL